MAKTSGTIPQPYPRIQDERRADYGCLDDSLLVPHQKKMPSEVVRGLILDAIRNANSKSSREILSIPKTATTDDLAKLYEREGKKLFAYFKKYCGDPASTAHQVYGKHYRDVGIEQFRNRTLQKERMNSGWRYQYLAHDCASHSGRFQTVSDLGAAEADFNVTIRFRDKSKGLLSLYVSVKNRSNTMGGQDWPKAIQALESIAKNDKNRIGAYCCVFGIAMERGGRYIKRDKKSKRAHSDNTEVWLSDFFWPFFSNYSYEEMMTLVLDVLLSSVQADKLPTQTEVPEKLLDSFGQCCRRSDLLDGLGNFDDPIKLVQFFCRK